MKKNYALTKLMIAVAVAAVLCACGKQQVVVEELPAEVVEETVVEEPALELTDPEEVELEVVEEPEEINPRDMKAIYDLDFDVPIYTEEEIEQAKINLKNNYDDYIITKDQLIHGGGEGYGYLNYVDYLEQARIVQEKAYKDYYRANQDLLYQLNDMVKDYKAPNQPKYYYDEENDMIIEISEHGVTKLISKTFYFWRDKKGIEENDFIYGEIGEMQGKMGIRVGRGSYVRIDSKAFLEEYYEYVFETIAAGEMYARGEHGQEYVLEFSDITELENRGFKRQKLNYEAINIED